MRMKVLSLLSTRLSLFTGEFYAPALPANDPASQYFGVKVVRVPTGPSTAALDKIKDLVSILQLDLWTTRPTINSHVDVEITPAAYDAFMTSVSDILGEAGILEPVTVMHEDLGQSILDESRIPDDYHTELQRTGSVANPAYFNAYHPYADHLDFLSDLSSMYPNNSKIVSVGNSFEGRAITGINIFGSSGSGSKPAIIWHATVHAREWIASMTTEYMAYQLLTNYANSTEIKGYVDKYDFYIFPVVNPDGFVYSQTTATNRKWRKNRQAPPPNSTCYGRDINRNWDVHWDDEIGASTDPCEDSYKGEAAFDAPETKALAAFTNGMMNRTQGVKNYIDWHSYAQKIFTPYGFTCKDLPADETELAALAKGFAASIKAVYGTSFTSGGACKIHSKTSGTAGDYAYNISKVKYTFVAELRDDGTYKFILPPDQIYPSGIEAWAGVRYLLANMK